MTDLSFIVPAWNEAGELPGTLKALREAGEASGKSFEIIVVDNASTDATAAVAGAEGARVVHEPHRQIARARNCGAAEARGRFLIFVDADTRVSPGLVKEALAALESGQAAGGGSLIRFSGGGLIARVLMAPWNILSRKAQWAAGSFVFCLREAWEGVGGFDERYYASEELWFSMALKRWGKARGLAFRVLEGHPAETSARKVAGWRVIPFLVQFLILNLCPWLLRSRRACFMWYGR